MEEMTIERMLYYRATLLGETFKDDEKRQKAIQRLEQFICEAIEQAEMKGK